MKNHTIGFDGEKKINERKPHLAVDVLGLQLAILLRAAGVDERSVTKYLVAQVVLYFLEILRVWAEKGCSGDKLKIWLCNICNCILEIVKWPRRPFQIVKWYWITERTFGWINWQKKLSNDYEFYEARSEAWIKIRFINLMVHRLSPG